MSFCNESPSSLQVAVAFPPLLVPGVFAVLGTISPTQPSHPIHTLVINNFGIRHS